MHRGWQYKVLAEEDEPPGLAGTSRVSISAPPPSPHLAKFFLIFFLVLSTVFTVNGRDVASKWIPTMVVSIFTHALFCR